MTSLWRGGYSDSSSFSLSCWSFLRKPLIRLFSAFLLGLSLSLLLGTVTAAEDGPPPLSLSGDGDVVAYGDVVTYRLRLLNGRDGLVPDATVSHRLPLGFDYVPGSTRVTAGGWPISPTEPSRLSRRLTWNPLTLPSAGHTANNHYGIHTFVQDFCDPGFVDMQLDQALELAGSGGHVTQLFYNITETVQGPTPCAVDYVNAAYDRNLVPIVRLQGEYDNEAEAWQKPDPGPSGDYAEIAAAYARFVAGLPRRDDQLLYLTIWNEPDTPVEWSNDPDPVEYARFFVAVSRAIRALDDPRIRVMNGPVTQFDEPLDYVREAMEVPGFADAFDVWGSHCYPFNHPPSYNIHDGTAIYEEATVDCHLRQLEVLDEFGRGDVPVIIKEAGYSLNEDRYAFEGFPAITEENRAEYIVSALRDYWSKWPEVVAVTPFHLGDPWSWVGWEDWEWIDYGEPFLEPTFHIGVDKHAQYDAVAALPKPYGEPIPRGIEIIFQARARTGSTGLYHSQFSASARGFSAGPQQGASVFVVTPSLQFGKYRVR